MAYRWRAGLVICASVAAVAASAVGVAAVGGNSEARAIPGGAFPDALAISPNGRTLYVADAFANDNAPANGAVWPFTLATGHRGRAIKVTGPPFLLAITPDGRMLFASDGDVITPIDLATGKTRTRIRTGLAPGAGAPPILMSRDGRTLFVAGEARIRRYNLRTGRFGPDLRANSPEAMLLSRDGRTLWYASYGNQVVVVNLTTGAVKTRIRLASKPVALAMTSDGRTLYVAVAGSGRPGHPAEVRPIHVATAGIGPGIGVGDPVALALAPNDRTLYVLATPPGSDGDGPTVRGWVTPITLATGKVGPRIRVGYAPAAIVVTHDGRTLYVANEDSETVSVISVRS